MHNTECQQTINTKELPELLSERHRESYGLSRTGWYQLLNRNDVPVVKIGGRKYLHREMFEKWLKEQVQTHSPVTVRGDT